MCLTGDALAGHLCRIEHGRHARCWHAQRLGLPRSAVEVAVLDAIGGTGQGVINLELPLLDGGHVDHARQRLFVRGPHHGQPAAGPSDLAETGQRDRVEHALMAAHLSQPMVVCQVVRSAVQCEGLQGLDIDLTVGQPHPGNALAGGIIEASGIGKDLRTWIVAGLDHPADGIALPHRDRSRVRHTSDLVRRTVELARGPHTNADARNTRVSRRLASDAGQRGPGEVGLGAAAIGVLTGHSYAHVVLPLGHIQGVAALLGLLGAARDAVVAVVQPVAGADGSVLNLKLLPVVLLLSLRRHVPDLKLDAHH